MMQIISLYIPKVYLIKLEELVNAQQYPNRSEAIRIAIRDFIIREFDRIREEHLNNPKTTRAIDIINPSEQRTVRIIEKLK